ncbi:MAG: addiction module protein [Verrucomicrobia bacterium]|jgi:hypothetical protein|nr:addiction module protein [Verrucomicrobiota bacterium]
MNFTADTPIEIPLERLSGKQKWDLFQTLWDSISSQTDSEEQRSPEWHATVLQERLDREARGEAVWRSVDDTFSRIEKQIAHGR